MPKVRKLSKLLLVLAVLTPLVLNASVLSDAAASLEPGDWVELNTVGFNAQLLDQGIHHALQYQESMKWDPQRGELHFVGSGHLEPYLHIVYSEATNSWSERPTPSYWGTSHGYDHMAIDPVGRRFFFRQFNSGRLEIYDLDNRTWSRSSTNSSGGWSVAGGLAWVPNAAGALFVDIEEVGLYQPSGDNWNRVTRDTSGMGGYHNWAEHSPVHDITMYGGGNGSSAMYHYSPSNGATRVNDAPVGMGIHQSVNVTDPISGNLLVFKEGSRHEYNPTTQSWSQFQLSMPYTDGADAGIVGTAAAPISTYGVIMLVKYDYGESRVFLYRHSPGEPPKRPLPARILQLD